MKSKVRKSYSREQREAILEGSNRDTWPYQCHNHYLPFRWILYCDKLHCINVDVFYKLTFAGYLNFTVRFGINKTYKAGVCQIKYGKQS